MKLKIILIIFLFCLANSIYAQKENMGGHTGNGGGSVYCPGKKPLVLDYWEAKNKNKKEKLLDLEKLSRTEFINLISNRIEIAQSKKREHWLYNETSEDFSQVFLKTSKEMGRVDSWPTISSVNILDEGFVDFGTDECVFKQAAYTNFTNGKHTTYRIQEVTDKLSHGQKLVLELHESLWSMQAEYILTSNVLREFVQALLKKNPSYKEIRMAYYQFTHPKQKIAWSKRDIKRLSGEELNLSVLDKTAVYILSKKVYGLHCPTWTVFGSAGHNDTILYQMGSDQSEVKTFFMKNNSHALVRIEWNDQGHLIFHRNIDSLNCEYQRIGGDVEMLNPKTQTLFPFHPYPEARHFLHAKNVVEHFSNIAMGLPSPFTDEVRAIEERITY